MTTHDLVIRLRPDIQWSQTAAAADASWVARDPVSSNFYYFSPLEKAMAAKFDGRAKFGEVLESAKLYQLTEKWLLGLVAKLESACLTVPNSVNRGGRLLWGLKQQQSRRTLAGYFLSPLAIRIKLFDPTRLLLLADPLARLLFSRAFAAAVLVLILLSGCAAVLELLARPLALENAFARLSGSRTVVLLLIFVCVKSLHELGHALACRKWRAECHEIGLFFLVFAPCLYCDTTDSWKLGRWQRACIAAAGIYIELVIAAIAALCWVNSPAASELHLLAASTMVICSVSTVLVNANPLLRYDGYYMLSDIWGVPNLHEQSREAAQACLLSWLTGSPMPAQRWDASPRLLSLYSVAAWCYRHLVVLLIVGIVWHLMDGIGIRLIGGLLVLLTLSSVVMAFIQAAYRLTSQIYSVGQIRLLRTLLCIAMISATLAAYLLLPLPTFVTARGYTSYVTLTPVYAEQAGILSSMQRDGGFVRAGDTLAVLDSPEHRLELIEARGEVQRLESSVEQLSILTVDVESAFTDRATAQELLQDAREHLAIVENEVAALELHAEMDGLFTSVRVPANRTLSQLHDSGATTQLSSQLGQLIERGAPIGFVADPAHVKATMLVAEHDAQQLRLDTPIRCRWDCRPQQIYTGRVSAIAMKPVESLPEPIIGDSGLALTIEADGTRRPTLPHYQVTIALEDWPPELSHQALVTGHFELAGRTMHEMVSNYLSRNLMLEW